MQLEMHWQRELNAVQLKKTTYKKNIQKDKAQANEDFIFFNM